MAQHPIQYAESHGNFLYSVSPPDTPLGLQQGLQSGGLSDAILYAVMQNHVGLCALLSGSVSPQRKGMHQVGFSGLIYSICGV